MPPKKLIRGKLVWKEKSWKQWHREKIHTAARKKIHADKSAEKKTPTPLPVISIFHSLIIIWRLWQRFFLLAPIRSQNDFDRLELVRYNSVPYSIHFLDAIFFRPFTVSLSSLALRGWLLISRRLVCLFLHWSVDTMTSLLMQLKTICSVQSVTYRWKLQCRRNVATDAAKRAFRNTSKGLHFLLTRNDYCSYHYVVCMSLSRSILSRVMFGSEWSFWVAYIASQFQFTSGNSDT